MSAFGLFEAFGVELEYMLVDGRTLAVLPAVDRLLEGAAGAVVDDVERDAFAWSNELVLHVLEIKTNGPARSLTWLADGFQREVAAVRAIAGGLGGRLLPTAMHPWMDPRTETRLWPHGSNEVYAAFDRIFGCRGHGWSNLQSAHLNLPFRGDDEFGRLHAAVRFLLPVLPALAASSPVVERRPTGRLDNRLDAYRRNCARIPSVTGQVVPEPVFTRADYERTILGRMYDDIAPHDPEGTLRDEWLNARGAIARFSRGSIEIRVLDAQECPAADLAILEAVVAALRALAEERWVSMRELQAWPVAPLAAILDATIGGGEAAMVADADYLRCLGVARPCSAGELWRRLADALLDPVPAPLQTILEQGTLARRILRALDSGRPLESVYGSLGDCLDRGTMFVA